MMKKIYLLSVYLLMSIVTIAQTIVQPSTAPVEEPTKSFMWDHIALGFVATVLAAFFLFVVYILFNKDGAVVNRLSKKLKGKS